LPVVFSLVFVGLFAIANPIIESWLESLGDWASQFGELFDIGRILFWGVLAVWLWALIRPRAASQNSRNLYAPNDMAAQVDRLLPASVIVRCLILFNLVFAVQTVLDMTYLAGGADLPEGMTYTEYARRGAYPLVATALLAGLFVIVTFRPGATKAQGMITARRLVYAFLAQNILLLISAIWRLNLYIDAYQMTRLRVAAAIWMGLVLIGFVWVIVRIVNERSNAWLVTVNAATAGVVLLMCCFVDFDAHIANYNVRAYTSGAKDRHWIDMDYLERLGPSSLPALYEFKKYDPTPGDPKDAEYVRWKGLQADDLIDRLVDRLDGQTKNWRGWTWRRSQLKRVVAANQEGQAAAEGVARK
jgi:hypothetical protein